MPNSTSTAWLVGFEGTPQEIRYELISQETIIGRGADCNLQLEDKLVSRLHAVIRFGSDGFEIEDLNSNNGTYLNEVEITKSPLKEMDRIRIGATQLQFRLSSDPDATIIQPREPQETVVANSETVPYEIGTVECPVCGESNIGSGKFCSSCGAVLPKLPENFQNTLEIFNKKRRSYQAGKITQEQYHADLANLMIQDQDGTYWMLGVESGNWHWYDGENWQVGDPQMIILGEVEEAEPEIRTAQDQELVREATPRGSSRGRLGALGLWIISALIVLVVGVYSVYEIIPYVQGDPDSYADPWFSSEDSPADLDLSETSGDAVLPTADTSISPGGASIRPYDPAGDSSLLRLTADTVYLEGQSTDLYSIYQGEFPSETPAVLVMSWCAIDQTTLESNFTSIYMEAALDEILISQDTWTMEDVQEEGMYCRVYRAVAENIKPGSHQYLWISSYEVPINDGWYTYPPGTYLNEFNINISGADQSTLGGYKYSDDFQDDQGHWGGLDLDEVQIWVEGGDLHIELNQAAVSGISHFQDRDFTDFSMVTSAHSQGDHSGMYGVVFRYQDDQNYYSFQVTELGSFRLIKVLGETTELIPWTESDLINGQGGTNELAISMQGDHILASINGQGVADLRDSSLSEGTLSLIAGSQVSMDYYHAVFQGVSIEAPE